MAKVKTIIWVAVTQCFLSVVSAQSPSTNDRQRDSEVATQKAEIANECLADRRIGSLIQRADAAGSSRQAQQILDDCVEARYMVRKIEAACRANPYVGGLLLSALSTAKPDAERSVLNDCVQATYRCWMDKTVAAKVREATAAGRPKEGQAIPPCQH